ncbi:MAG: terpene cyclase/mutase family protein [Planctomycetes bacterium]|nr:terpene cyclase/mutase family protein [Planctomycetota bacterium]
MAQLDPTKIKVESNAVPIWETETSFQDVMAEQLRHAPWLMLSIVLHVIVFGLLYVLMPADNKNAAKNITQVQMNEEQKVEEPPPPPPPEPKKEETKEEPIIQDNEVTEQQNEAFDNVDNNVTSKESAFDSNQWNSAVGLGGGAGGKYGGRRGGRGGGGGGKAQAKAIEAGLEWLKNHQDEDGKWDTDGFMKHDVNGEPCDGPGNPVHDVGVTGLALLAFLGDGSTMRSGPYKETVRKAVKWLRDQQDPNNGLFGTNASHDFIYSHAIAAYAMCEAYGLSESTTIKKNAQMGINYLESHRNPYSVWRYQPRDNDNDTSVTGWCIMAYESAQFFKLDVSTAALKLCETWLDQVTDSTGRCGYTKAGEPSSRHPGDHGTRFPTEKGEAMTAVGLFCRYFMGQGGEKDDAHKAVMTAAADLILTKPPIWDTKAGTIDEYYWYYATYALFQKGGRHWTDWSKKLVDAVVKPQRSDGNFKGSWDPIGAWGEDGGRVYTTAILVLTLEAYYRYTKLVR